MITVPATEFSKNFGRYRETVQREPVAVTNHDRITGYFVSSMDYEEYMCLKSRTPKTFAVEELSDATLQAIAAATMDKRQESLNALLNE